MKFGLQLECISTNFKGKLVQQPNVALGNASKLCKGVIEIVSVCGLFGEVVIICHTSPKQMSHINDWLQRNDITAGIICSEQLSAEDVIEQQSVDLIIGFPDLCDQQLIDVGYAICWNTQPWLDVLQEILVAICQRKAACLGMSEDFRLESFEYASDQGSSPVFILSSTNGQKRKLRVCHDIETRDRIVHFLHATEEAQYSHVARLEAVYGLSVVKSYLPGTPTTCIDEASRPRLIQQVGQALATLHAIPVESSGIQDAIPSDSQSRHWLVCGADNFNTIVMPNGQIAFIDLEACTRDVRWVDVMWSQELLCRTDEEWEIFIRSYLDASHLELPTAHDEHIGKIRYLSWLIQQTQKSSDVHPRNSVIRKRLNQLRQRYTKYLYSDPNYQDSKYDI